MQPITRFGPQAPVITENPPVLYECGICGSLHPWELDGDCRDNNNRYAGIDEYAERNGVSERSIVLMSWEDRCELLD